MLKFPPKKIMVAYDILDPARTAWRHAAALAGQCGAALEAVYVDPWQPGPELMLPPEPSASHVRALRASIRARIGEGPRITVLRGEPSQRLLSSAKRSHPDLIVVGTHGRKGIMRAIIGSTAESVVRRSPVPVLVARGPVRRVRGILAPVNFTSYSEYGFDFAAAAAAVLGARLTALHVADDPMWSWGARRRLEGLIGRLPAEVRARCRPAALESAGDPVKEILKARAGKEWIVLVSHEKSAIRDAFFGTTLERVLRGSSIPVLSVPVPGRVPFALRLGSGRAVTLT